MNRPVTGRTEDSISLPDEDKQQEEEHTGDTTHNRTEPKVSEQQSNVEEKDDKPDVWNNGDALDDDIIHSAHDNGHYGEGNEDVEDAEEQGEQPGVQ